MNSRSNNKSSKGPPGWLVALILSAPLCALLFWRVSTWKPAERARFFAYGWLGTTILAIIIIILLYSRLRGEMAYREGNELGMRARLHVVDNHPAPPYSSPLLSQSSPWPPPATIAGHPSRSYTIVPDTGTGRANETDFDDLPTSWA